MGVTNKANKIVKRIREPTAARIRANPHQRIAQGRNKPGANIASTMTTIASRIKLDCMLIYPTSKKMSVKAKPASRHCVVVNRDGEYCMGTFYIYMWMH